MDYKKILKLIIKNKYRMTDKLYYFESIHWHIRNYEALQLMGFKPWNRETDGILVVNHYRDGLEAMKQHSKVIIGPGIDFMEAINLFKNINSETMVNFKQPQIIYNVLSPWQLKLFEKYAYNPYVVYKSLPFSIDTESYKPAEIKENCFIIYIKDRHPLRVQANLREIFSNEKLMKNYTYRIFVYGQYTESDIKEYTSKCKFGIIIGRHESQGYFVLSCLSLQTPVLVDSVSLMQQEYCKGGFIWKNLPFQAPAKTMSYFDENCGMITYFSFKQEDINTFVNNVEMGKYNPRQFIVENLSVGVCVERFRDVFTNVECV